MFVEARQVQPERPGLLERSAESGNRRLEGGRVDDPVAEVGVAVLAGQPLEFVDSDPAAFTDHPVDGSVRPSPGRPLSGVDVEHLASTNRLGPAALPEHEAVAG